MPDPPLYKGTFFSHGTGKKSAHFDKTQLSAHILHCSAKGSRYSRMLMLGACLRSAKRHRYRAIGSGRAALGLAWPGLAKSGLAWLPGQARFWGRVGSARVGPGLAGPGQAGPSQAPGQTGPDLARRRARLGQAGPC